MCFARCVSTEGVSLLGNSFKYSNQVSHDIEPKDPNVHSCANTSNNEIMKTSFTQSFTGL